jgi:hypothetical protein
VAAFDERVAFYAAARSILLAKIDAASMATYLRDQKADYFAAEARIIEKMLPEVSRRPEQFGLVLEQKFIGTRNDRMLLFKVS